MSDDRSNCDVNGNKGNHEDSSKIAVRTPLPSHQKKSKSESIDPNNSRHRHHPKILKKTADGASVKPGGILPITGSTTSISGPIRIMQKSNENSSPTIPITTTTSISTSNVNVTTTTIGTDIDGKPNTVTTTATTTPKTTSTITSAPLSKAKAKKSSPSDSKNTIEYSNVFAKKNPMVLPSVINIVSGQLQFQSLFFAPLKDFLEYGDSTLSATCNCLVVGVMGSQCSGKSFVLNTILDPTRPNGPFKVMSLKNLIQCQNQTCGIDMYASSLHEKVTNIDDSHRPNLTDRLILLDVQSLPTASMLANLKKFEPQLMSDTKNYEHMLHLSALQIGLFLFSVCNVVLIVDDKMGDLSCWEFVKTIDMLKRLIPDITNLSSSAPSHVVQKMKKRFSLFYNLETYKKNLSEFKKSFATTDDTQMQNSDLFLKYLDTMEIYDPNDEFFPSLLFVFNRVNIRDHTQKNLYTLKNSLSRFFANSRLSKKQRIDCCMLPNATNDFYKEFAESLIHKLLTLPKPKFPRPISSKEWLINASKMWEIIKSSPFLSQYNEVLKDTVYYK